MITLSNLRTEQAGDWIRLVCDFTWSGDTPNPFTEKTIWFSVKNENADFFSTKVYDPFLIVPYYVAMHYSQDLKICGNVSAKLYHNLTNYVQRIFLDFSDKLRPVKLEVEGFDVPEQDGDLIGAGISCGVDSLSTLYDHFVKEIVPGYKINALFLFNAGTHGFFSDLNTHVLFEARYNTNKRAADELELPIYAVESNIHFFAELVGQNRLGYLANWSCILSLQRKVQKYYVSSCFSYEIIAAFHRNYHDFDIDEFCGTYLLPLIKTEQIELIYDGAQYTRSSKIENIIDWGIAQKYLNVCLEEKATAENCSCCSKCLRTLSVIDSLGKLDKYADVFDLKKYKKHRLKNNCIMLVEKNSNAYSNDNINFARAHQVRLPPIWFAYIYVALLALRKGCGKIARQILGKENYMRWKQTLRR